MRSARPEPHESARSLPLVSGRPARIMLAEDDPEMRSLLASGLRKDGYDVIASPTGFGIFEEIGLLLFRGEAVPADLIISDERMPGMFGLEVLAALRKAGWPIPFILITGFGDRQTHEKAIRLGAAAVFDKPFDIDDLRGTILTLLRGGKPSNGAERGRPRSPRVPREIPERPPPGG